ncbi:translocase of chloroplast 159, chloroplastic [Nicotiana sylvestris]|uniref:Translocase of chloroplast 159, chloroplastic isoform X1 n=1 Tax=Nicotiana sylvestris TaxID=4096 RepID=A0A1U7WTH0_NICSY|nr:PREDICTED: translocase of chloroplast 159, chloroplastic isoform X1 [Nicotiana sylvestris]
MDFKVEATSFPPVVSSPSPGSSPINNSSSSLDSQMQNNVANTATEINNNNNSYNSNGVSDDGTLVSGGQREKIVTGSERPLLADPDEKTVEKSIGEEQPNDSAEISMLKSVKPVSEVSMIDGVEKVEVLGGEKGEGITLSEDSGGVGGSVSEGNTEELNSVDESNSIEQVKESGGEIAVGTELKKGVDGSTQEEVKEIEENEKDEALTSVASSNLKGAVEPDKTVIEESATHSDDAEKPNKAVVEPSESLLVEANREKFTLEGDAVVDAIDVNVNVSAPGVAVGGDVEESAIPSDDAEKPNEEVVEPSESLLVGAEGEITPEGDAVVDAIDVNVNVSAPGVVVVGDVEESEVNVSALGVPVVGDVEGSVVNVSAPGVAVVGDVEESKEVEQHVESPADVSESLLIEADGEKFTSDGDAVVDAIDVNVSGTGVAIVGDVDENKEVKEHVESTADENVTSVNGVGETRQLIEEVANMTVDEVDVQKSKPAVDDNVAAAESKPVDIIVGAGSDEKLDAGDVQTGDAVAATEEIKEADPESGNISPDVKDVEKEPEQAVSETIYANGDHSEGSIEGDVVEAEVSGQSSAIPRSISGSQQILEADGEAKDQIDEEAELEGSISDGETDGMIFGSSEAARQFIEELERESGGDSYTGAEASHDHSQEIDGQIVTDSDEEADTDEEGDGKELFDSAALAALLKAATGADSDGGNITITSQDGSRLFSVERPAGLGSSLRSLRPAPQPNRPNLFTPSSLQNSGESENNLSEEEKKKLEKLQQIRVKFLRLIHRLGFSSDESIAAQVLYRLALIARRQNSPLFSLEAAKMRALQLEAEGEDDLDFSVNIQVIGKSGVGKSATINSIFGEEKTPINAFGPATTSVKEISGVVEGVKIRVFDTPGLKSSVMEQGFNRSVLSSAKKFTKKNPPDIFLYVDRLDAQTRDLNDLPMLKTITSCLGPSIWRSAIVTLTHGASAPPDGPSGSPLSYEVFVTQRSHVVQQSIGQAVGDLRMMSPSLMNPVSLVENHPSCRKNREGQKILPNGQSWRPQLLLLCYSMKILSEASALSKPEDPFDHRKLFGFRTRSPPLPYMLSSMLQSRAHPKLPAEQGGDNGDSDIDLDDLSESDQEEEDEYDQLPPFKPLRKAQLAKLSKEQRKAYFEEYDYRVKLLQKKQWREELRRMREMKNNKGKEAAIEYGYAEEDADTGAAAPVAVPLPDMVLPPSFDSDNPAYRYRFLEPTSQFLARPVLDTHGWDHDCGYDGVNVEQSLAIASRFPAAVTVQITKDKKDFSINLDSSISAKHGDNGSTMAGFDIQSIGKQLAYIVRGETKFKILKKNKTAGGISVTFLGENVVTGLKVEDQITLGKQYVLVGSTGTVRSQSDTAYGANFELQRREADFPIGQVQSTLSMSVIKWRGDLALGFNSMAQFAVGRNSKVAVRAGINNKLSGQITVRTSSSDHLSLALSAIIPTAIGIYRKLWPDAGEKYSIY